MKVKSSPLSPTFVRFQKFDSEFLSRISGLSDWKFHSILTKIIIRSPTRCSQKWSADDERQTRSQGSEDRLRWKSGSFLNVFPSENPRKMFSFTLKFFTTTGRYFSVGSLTNTRSKIISIFATITNIVKVSALLIKMFFHLVKIQYGGARERHAQREGIASPKEECSSQTVNWMRRIRAELVTRPRADHKSLWMKEREKVKLGKYHQQLLFRSRWDHSNSSQEFRESTVTTRRRNVSIESTQREFYFLMTKVRRQVRA